MRPLTLTKCLLVLVATCGVSSPQVYAQYSGSEPPPEAIAKGFNSITPERCKEWLNIVAGPEFAGRGTGQPGHVKAAHWVAGKCAEFGLQPVGDAGTYFQMLPMTQLKVASDESKITGPNELSIPFTGSVALDRFSADPVKQGQLSFVSLGGTEAQLDSSAELRDKIVVLTADEDLGSRGIFTLMRRRPAAVLQIVDKLPESSSQLQTGRNRSSLTTGYIKREVAKQLLEAASGEEAWLESAEENKSTVHHSEVSITIEARVFEEPASVPNVLAWYPGSDPEVSDEYLVIGAHLDHLGERGDTVYPGADDNGSGSTAILTIAKAIAENPTKPKRSILFIWFAAEEMGLVGSKHYVDNPALPLDKMIGMLNMDMVGRNEETANDPVEENIEVLHLVGSKKGDPAFHDMIMAANKYVNVTFEFDAENVFGRSDQINFFRKGVSVAFVFGGFHPDYHRPTDLPGKINYDKIAAAAKLFYVAAYEAADHGFYPVPKLIEKKEAKD